MATIDDLGEYLRGRGLTLQAGHGVAQDANGDVMAGGAAVYWARLRRERTIVTATGETLAGAVAAAVAGVEQAALRQERERS